MYLKAAFSCLIRPNLRTQDVQKKHLLQRNFSTFIQRDLTQCLARMCVVGWLIILAICMIKRADAAFMARRPGDDPELVVPAQGHQPTRAGVPAGARAAR